MRRFDPETVQNGHIYSSINRRNFRHFRHFLWVRLRVLVMDEMSLEV